MISPETIRSKKDFDLLYRKGTSANGKFFYLKYLYIRNSSDPSRYAIVIGTKVSKKSVERNRKKRQIREIIRKHGEEIKNGVMFLVLAKEEILGVEYGEMEKELMGLLKKAGITN